MITRKRGIERKRVTKIRHKPHTQIIERHCRDAQSLTRAANGKVNEDEFKVVTAFYGSDLNPHRLKTQLEFLKEHFRGNSDPVTFCTIKEYFITLSPTHKIQYAEVITVLKLILVLPATNATSERTFSAMRRVKTYLRATMKQERLNHLMIPHIHRYFTDDLHLTDTFVNSEHRLRIFGKCDIV